MMLKDDKDIDTYLARIRKTIADSKRMVSQVKLRIAETDRMLEQQGLTREQVMAMRFSDAQMEAVNDELKRRGLDPLERWERGDDGDWSAETSEARAQGGGRRMPNDAADLSADAELENRQRKFGMMMRPFQL